MILVCGKPYDKNRHLLEDKEALVLDVVQEWEVEMKRLMASLQKDIDAERLGGSGFDSELRRVGVELRCIGDKHAIEAIRRAVDSLMAELQRVV